MAKLILSMDGLVLKEIPLDKERMSIGRKASNDIQIDNLAISGEHAAVVTILSDSFLEDLNSTNGTLVNGQPVKKHFLKNGDVIELGKYKLKYVSEVPQQADAADFDPLLHKAETAMYRVKDEGRNHYCFFTPELQARSSRTLGLAQALKHAQQRGELHLVYQPQIALDGERIVGIEALLRWNSPQWGHVSPGEFIPIAESTGLIVPLGEWVLRTALAQLRVWRDMGLPPLLLAVNLSAVQFNQTDLPELVAQVLQEAGVPPQCLELELTEAVAMKNPEAAAARIAALESQGVQLSIDDFGTGYSSLSYLKRFRLHKLKIDQSFVRELDHDTEDQAIVMAIIQLARSLGLRTLAEGVETPEQLAFLRQHGCQLVQGYHFSKPLPPAQLLDFVRQRSSAAPASSSSTSA